LLTYKNPDGQTVDSRTINLANPPLPDPTLVGKESTDDASYQQRLKDVVKQREEIVQRRASELPDPSIEQIFLTEDFKSAEASKDLTRTPNFTVRTSEKDPELVQASLDRLLRDPNDGQPLMKKVYMDFDRNFDPFKNR